MERQGIEQLCSRYEKLYSGVIYDSIIFDLKYDAPFVVDSSIKNRTHKGCYFGKAFTCLGAKVNSLSELDDTVRIKMFDHFYNGCIQVIDTGSDKSVAHFGDISGKLARKFGAKCAVIDGYTRDADILSEDEYSVFCRSTTPIDAFERWQIVDYQCDIELPAMNNQTVKVTPNDFLFCDGDGVLVINESLVLDVIKLAEERNIRENMVRKEIMNTNNIQHLYDRIGRW
jgi:regulator of RNase E activity RraA